MLTPQTFRVATRGFASQAPVAVPAKVHGLSGRYATALFAAASRKSSLGQVETDMNGLAKLLSENKTAKLVFESPLIQKQAKLSAIDAIASKTEYKLSATTKDFLGVLIENKRLDLTEAVIRDFAVLTSAAKGENNVTVTSHKALSEKQLAGLKTSLSKFPQLKKGTIKIENKVNASILGGLIIDIGDQSIDMSIASRISKLNRSLQEAV